MSDTIASVAGSLTSLSNLFKIKYDKKSYAVFNTYTPTWGKVGKEFDMFKGKSLSIDAILGYSGSVGSGSLPLTNVWEEQNASLTRKKLYARILLDREAMIASKGDEHAFEQVTKRAVRKGVESFMRNVSRQLFAIENGMVGKGDNSTVVTGAGTSGAPYVVVLDSATFVQAFVEKKDYWNCGSETTTLEVVAFTPSTRSVSLAGTSATLAAVSSTGGSSSATAAKFYMQGSKDNDIQSILAATKATSSTLYGVTVADRWQSAQLDASSAGLTTDLVNQIVTQVEFQSGESPDLLVTSYKQFRKFQNLLSDRIRYTTVGNSNPAFNKAQYNSKGIEWMTQDGPVPLVFDRMCPDDHFFALNTENIRFLGAEKPRWADDDGTVFLRLSTADQYEARYIGYGELFVHPTSQGVMYNLA